MVYGFGPATVDIVGTFDKDVEEINERYSINKIRSNKC